MANHMYSHTIRYLSCKYKWNQSWIVRIWKKKVDTILICIEIRKRQLKIIFRLIQQLALIIFPKCTIKFFPLCLTVCNHQECRFKVHGHKNVGPRYTCNIRISWRLLVHRKMEKTRPIFKKTKKLKLAKLCS